MKEALKGCDRLDVADFVGMSLGGFNNMVAGQLPYHPKGTSLNFVERTLNLIDIIYDQTGRVSLLEKMAEEFGFMVIANPAIRADHSPAIQQVSEMMSAFSELLLDISKANADGIIDKYEAEKLRAAWEKMKRETEEFIIAAETGHFAKERGAES
jgi:hypothetical protein